MMKRFLQGCSQMLRRLSIRVKITAVCMLSVCLMLVASVLLSQYIASGAIRSNGDALIERYIEQVEGNVRAFTEEVEGRARELSASAELLRAMRARPSDTQDNRQWEAYQARLKYVLSGYLKEHPSLRWGAVRDASGQLVIGQKVEDDYITESLVRTLGAKCERRMRSAGRNAIWTRVYPNEDDMCYVLHMFGDHGEQTGALMLCASLSDVLIAPGKDTMGRVILFDRYGDVLYCDSMDDRLIVNSQSMRSIREKRSYRFRGVDYAVQFHEIGRLGWTVAFLVEEEDMFGEIRLLQLALLIAALVALLIALLLTHSLAGSLSRRLDRLGRNMSLAGSGDLQIRMNSGSGDEIEMIGRQFDIMVQQIDYLMAESERERTAISRAEFQALQAQINPHFLYNSLGSIKWLAHMHGEADIERMTVNLIELLRMSIKNGGGIWTIRDEVKYLDMYADLQKYRYDNCFTLRVRVEDGLNDKRILGFVLQPLVENALFHGLDLTRADGEIRVEILERSGVIEMSVSDNGAGMSEDCVRELMSAPSSGTRGMNKIGLRNIDERIKLNYGLSYGVRVYSRIAEGTRVVVVQPEAEGGEADGEGGDIDRR